MADDLPTYHVLALSGGGYRGLYTATILAELEAALGAPLADRFDLICGTSVGGILALGLAKEIPAGQLKDLFLKNGPEIFGRRRSLIPFFRFWINAKHSSSGLKGVLESEFKDATIGDLKHRVLVPSVNYTTGRGQFFKTPHHPTFELDYRMSLTDVAMATTAAPVYFPLFSHPRGVYVDGGLVGNAPGLFGLHEIDTFIAGDERARVRVLSIGTMTVGATISGGANLDKGVFRWAGGLFNLVISAQESSVDYMLRQRLRNDYYTIDDQVTPDQSDDVRSLDLVTEASTNTLTRRGMHAAQRALGDPSFDVFRGHKANDPIFFHGPKANSSED